MMNTILSHMKVMLICLLAILLTLACGGGGGGDDGGGGQATPQATLSADQQKLITDNGNPAYLTIIAESENGVREEAWTYLGEANKMYFFWDGDRVREESINVDPALYSNPAFINPALFTENTQKSHIIKLFGNNYSSFEDEAFEGDEAWYFVDQGLAVSFQGELLLMVKTLDKP